MQHLIIQFPLYYLSRGRFQGVQKNRKFQTFSSKSCHGRLREVVAFKRFQIELFDLETFGNLENWSLRRCGHNKRCNQHDGMYLSVVGREHLRTKFITITHYTGTAQSWKVLVFHYMVLKSPWIFPNIESEASQQSCIVKFRVFFCFNFAKKTKKLQRIEKAKPNTSQNVSRH